MTSEQVADRAGVTFRQLDYWVRTGRIPGIDRLVSVGSGCPRAWTTRDANHVAFLARLVKAGVRLEVAATVLRTEVDRGSDIAALREVRLPGGLTLQVVPALQVVPS